MRSVDIGRDCHYCIAGRSHVMYRLLDLGVSDRIMTLLWINIYDSQNN
jgi:hypothetical protein